jgi:hypothetical protein
MRRLYLKLPFFFNYKLNKDVPVWIPSNSLTVNLAGFNNYGRYLLLLNNYVQNNGSVDGFEIYCTESREILLRVKL